jgi:ubiquinol-cytochrome c reductase cytochrome c subunit
VACLLAVILTPATRTVAQAPTAPTATVDEGKKLYASYGCYQCHGYQGQGGREGPRIAAPVPLAFPALNAFVRTTSGDMPPFTEKVLSNQELVDIFAYLQSIPAPPDHKTIPLLAQ